jgi:hypothetical protein
MYGVECSVIPVIRISREFNSCFLQILSTERITISFRKHSPSNKTIWLEHDGAPLQFGPEFTELLNANCQGKCKKN